MSLPDLAAVLWRQRSMLERLMYRMECAQIMLAAGRTRWLALSTDEVEASVAELQLVEIQRATVSQDCARELGLDPASTLERLAAASPEPWAGVLLEHRDALVVLMRDISRLAQSNRQLMGAGLQAVERTLASLGLATDPEGYTAEGHAAPRPDRLSTVVDQRV